MPPILPNCPMMTSSYPLVVLLKILVGISLEVRYSKIASLFVDLIKFTPFQIRGKKI